MNEEKQNAKREFVTAGVSLALIATLLSGCQSQTRLSPALADQRVSGWETAASEEMQAVSILVEAEAWAGDPEIEAYVTPLRVEIINKSDVPLRLRYNDFALVGPADGTRFAALPPYQIEGSVTERVHARYEHAIDRIGFRHSRFHVSPFYDGLYPGLPYWSSSFHYDPFYYDHYHEYWLDIPLPTEEMLRSVIPEGVVDPGGSLTGFLYFEKVDSEVPEVEFRYELTNATTGERFGMLTIPFLVYEE